MGQSTGGVGFFTPGIHTIQFNKLNDYLPAGYPEITNKPLVTGGAGYAIISNFIIGGEGGTMHAGSFKKDNQQVDLTGDYSYFSLGYLVMKKKGYMIYPLISIGSNSIDLYVHERNQDVSFNAAVSEPFQATTFLYKTKMLKLSATGLYTLKGSRANKATGGLMVGLEAGYQLAYRTGKWTYDNGNIVNGPDFSNNGFFIQLLIGGGGVIKK